MSALSFGLILSTMVIEPKATPPQKMSYAAAGTARRPSAAPRDTGALIEIEPLPRFRDVQGTAFGISGGNRWMTARHVIENCNSGRLASASEETDLEELLVSQEDDVAIVRSRATASPHFRFAEAPPPVGATAYLFGFPQGGEYAVAVKLMGRATARQGFRPYAHQPVLLWVESGSMPGGSDELSGMSGGLPSIRMVKWWAYFQRLTCVAGVSLPPIHGRSPILTRCCRKTVGPSLGPLAACPTRSPICDR